MTPTDSRALTWSTPPAALAVCAAGGIVLAVAAVLSKDSAGRLLIGLAALALLVMAGVGLRQRPRLAIEPGTADPIVVRGVSGPKRYTPQQVIRARVVNYRRLGRKMPMLELDVNDDGDERLLIFGRWDLGAHPEDVLESLRTHLAR
ncbi:PH domain-containing protein [Nocardia uniformis]|uniref:PH domain-containing protein n=1 Tax=Nocardia uniformis TaxID=53432 RepID=A0A849CCX0_9NOCA|nr:PH domain-containing protein [Nocardia uniformis]NNH73957.1 PH domain-containing protein [Nocardia uniformis]